VVREGGGCGAGGVVGGVGVVGVVVVVAGAVGWFVFAGILYTTVVFAMSS
jgi:hypothetical protein